MKKNLIKIVTISAVFALGIGATITIKNSPNTVEATQHSGNFSSYTYSGNYYSSLSTSGTDGLNGTFRKALTTYIYPKGWYIYSGGGSDHLSGVLQSADADPTNSSNMIMFYTRDSIKKTAATVNGEMQWNREHVWPQSLSINTSGTQCWGTEEAGTDILHLRPTYETCNSTRGNKIYKDVSKSNPQTYNGMTYGYVSGNYFEPLDEVKGDVARIIMYTWTAYTDHYSGLNVTKTIANYDTLLKWHTMDKPDALEAVRNNYCETSKQNNRNPFVDHPEYAWRIFGDSASASVKSACIEAYPGDGNSSQSGSSSSNPVQSSNTVVSSNNQISSSVQASSVAPVAGQYSVTFKTNSADSGTDVTSSNISNQISNNTLIESAGNISKVYPGKSGLKLGSNSATGSITFNLKNEAKSNIESIDIESTQYSSDSGKLSVKLDNTTIASDITPGVSFHKDLNKVSASTITISTTSKRAYINKITITIADTTPVQSSSSEPISSSVAISSDEESSAPISSSSEAISSSEVSSSEIVSSEPNSSSEAASSSEAVSSNEESSYAQNSSSEAATSVEETTSNEPENSSEEAVSSEQEASSEAQSSSEEVSSEVAISSENTNISSEDATSSEVAQSENPIPTSQNETNTSVAPQQPEQPVEESEEKGCNGSVVASLSVMSIAALMSVVFIFAKKKQF